MTGKTGQTAKDDLREIKGIGPTYEKRLNSSGIYTFADLAAMDPDDVRAIVNARRQIDVDLWVDQAKEMAAISSWQNNMQIETSNKQRPIPPPNAPPLNAYLQARHQQHGIAYVRLHVSGIYYAC